jgi:hypothetical protein
MEVIGNRDLETVAVEKDDTLDISGSEYLFK